MYKHASFRTSEVVDAYSSIPTTPSVVAHSLIQTCLHYGWATSAQSIFKEAHLDKKQHHYYVFKQLLEEGSIHEVFQLSSALLKELGPTLSPAHVE
ncbi:hypothetical protein HMI56_005803, partial [Coelomomyces lativittatus]